MSVYRQWLLFGVMMLVGLEQDLPALAREVGKAGAIVLSLGASYLLFPLLAWSVGLLFFKDSEIMAGFVVLGAVPVTLTSAVIYTRLDQGNARLALVIVLLSQLVSVVLTPTLVYLFMSRHVDIALAPMMLSLLEYFLAPLALGMALRRLLHLSWLGHYVALPQQLVIASYVFLGAGHIPHETPVMIILKAILAVIVIQMLVVVIVRFAIRRYPAWDQTALYFTSTQKTLTVGLYLLLNYFPPLAVLPMVLYHLMQLAIGRLYWLPANQRRSPCL